MHSNTFYDRPIGAVVLGLITFASGICGFIHAFHGFAATTACPIVLPNTLPDTCNAAAPILMLIGSIASFMFGLVVSMVAISAALYGDKLVGITWTGINNMFAGLLSSFAVLAFGLSSTFNGSVSSICAGAFIAGLGAAAMAATLFKWP